MASIVVVRDADGERAPLLHNSHAENSSGETEYSKSRSVEPPPPENSKDPKQRLVSLDVFRGLTVAVSLLYVFFRLLITCSVALSVCMW